MKNKMPFEITFIEESNKTEGHEYSDVRFKNSRLLGLVRSNQPQLSECSSFLLKMVDEFQKAFHQVENKMHGQQWDHRKSLEAKLDDLQKKNKELTEKYKAKEIEMSKAEEKLQSYITAVRSLKTKNTKLTNELKESMKVIKAQKAAGSTIDKDCMTGACQTHRIDLVVERDNYCAEASKLKHTLTMSWIGFGIMGALLLFFRKVI